MRPHSARPLTPFRLATLAMLAWVAVLFLPNSGRAQVRPAWVTSPVVSPLVEYRQFDSAVASGQRDLEAFALLVAGHAELALGRLDAAREAYAASRDRLQALNLRAQQVLDPVSGLARVALAAGDLPEALAQVELMLAHQAAGGSFDGTEEPLLLPLTRSRTTLRR